MKTECPYCGEVMKKGQAKIHGNTLGFLIVGISYQNLYFRAENEGEIRILESGCSVYSMRCESCGIVILNKPDLIKAEDLSDSEFSSLTRTDIVEIITLWSSRELQTENQKTNPDINLIEAMFIQWKDLFAFDSEDFRNSFSKHEIDLLIKFDKEINSVFKDSTKEFPEFMEFVGSPDWINLNRTAKEIVKEIENQQA
jgi:hypothetical protein